jgi:hypothetical protein
MQEQLIIEREIAFTSDKTYRRGNIPADEALAC